MKKLLLILLLFPIFCFSQTKTKSSTGSNLVTRKADGSVIIDSLLINNNLGVNVIWSDSLHSNEIVSAKIKLTTGALLGYLSVSDATGLMTWTDPTTLGFATTSYTDSKTTYVTVGNANADFIGNTDATVQSAIDSVDSRGGGTVFIKAGTYNFTAAIQIPSNIRIVGESKNTVIFEKTADVLMSLILSGSDVDSVIIERLTIDGNHIASGYTNGNHGISFTSANECIVRDVIVRDVKNSGIIFVANVDGVTYNVNNLTENCEVSLAQVGILHTKSKQSKILNCKVYDISGSPAYGIELKNDCIEGTIDNCYTENCEQGGIVFGHDGGETISATRSIVSNCIGNGNKYNILISDSDDCEIIDNVGYGSTSHGSLLVGIQRSLIRITEISSAANGIDIDDSGLRATLNNIFEVRASDNVNYGIRFRTNSANNIVRNSYFDNNTSGDFVTNLTTNYYEDDILVIDESGVIVNGDLEQIKDSASLKITDKRQGSGIFDNGQQIGRLSYWTQDGDKEVAAVKAEHQGGNGLNAPAGEIVIYTSVAGVASSKAARFDRNNNLIVEGTSEGSAATLDTHYPLFSQVKGLNVSEFTNDANYITSSGLHDPVTLATSATTGGLSLSTQEIGFRAATNAQTGYATAAHITAIEANTTKTTNATHTGDVTGSIALTIAVDAVDIAMLSATGTPSSSTYLRGDNTWNTPSTSSNNYVDNILFGTSTGILTLERSGLGDLTQDLDGRWIQSPISSSSTVDATLFYINNSGTNYAQTALSMQSYWNANLAFVKTTDIYSEQSLTSSTSITMNFNTSPNAYFTIGHNATLTITNIPAGGYGTITVLQGSGAAYTLNINGSTGYTTERVMGNKSVIDPTLSSETVISFRRTNSKLYYQFIYEN